MPGIYTEKEIYGDALAAQKATTGLFNMAAKVKKKPNIYK